MNSVQQQIVNGGVQYVPQIAAQYVYLDFDGELTSYNGEILTVGNVEVKDSSLTSERIADIVAGLNAKYSSQNVIFVTERPTAVEYSTIFIGKTSAFDQYGQFAGLAETIDSGNKNKHDNAFVVLDSTSSNEQIISTICHETNHLLGTLDHGGAGLQAYASTYWVKDGESSTGIVLNGYSDWLFVSSGGTALSPVVNSRGQMYVNKGGSALDVVINEGGMLAFAVASGTYIQGTFHGSAFEVKNAFLSGYTVSGNYMGGSAVVTVAEGGAVYDTTLIDAGRMFVESGGIVHNTLVTTQGGLGVSNGAIAKNTTVTNHGGMSVSSGGIAMGVVVTQSGSLYIASGGTAIDFTVSDGGRLSFVVAPETYIKGNYYGSAIEIKDAVLSDYTIYDGCHIYICGTAENIIVSGGGLEIDDGGYASGVIANPGCEISVASGGTAVAVKENGGAVWVEEGAEVSFTPNELNDLVISGYATLHSGTTGRDIFAHEGGTLIVNGGRVENVTLGSAGDLVLTNNGTASSTVVKTQGWISVGAGGKADDTEVFDGGYMEIFFGGTANNTVNSGTLTVFFGAAANVVENVGSVIVDDGGVVNSVFVHGFGELTISSGGVANNTRLLKNAFLTLLPGAVINDTVICQGGTMEVGEGVVADNILVNQSGSLRVASGGTASILFNPWQGNISSKTGAVIQYLDRDAGIYLGNSTSGIVSKGNYFDNTVISSGLSALVYDGGVISGGVIEQSLILSGGIAEAVRMENDADILVCSGGIAEAVRMEGFSYMLVRSGGTANNTVVNSYCSLEVEAGGVVRNTEIHGTVNVWGGIEIDGTVVKSGGILHVREAGCVANNTYILAGGTMKVWHGCSASVLFNPWQGNISSERGAVIQYLDRDAGIYLGNLTSGIVSKGNYFDNIVISSGLSALIYEGGVISDGIVGEAGILDIQSGGSANRTTVNSGGHVTVNKQGCVSSMAVAAGGNMILAGGSADNTVLAGNMIIEDGGFAENTLVESSASISVFNGGCASGITVDSSGMLEINFSSMSSGISNVSVSGLNIQQGGEVFVNGAGSVSQTDVSGIVSFESKSLLKESVVHSGGITYLLAHAEGQDITVSLGGTLYVAMAGNASGINIDGGAVHVTAGGRISDICIENEGQLFLYGGAILDGEINVRGTVILDDTATNNGNVNFVLEESSSVPMLSHMNRLSGGSCSVTVANSGEGEYLIAGNAEEFDDTLTIRDGNGNTAGILSTENFVTVDDTIYTMSNNNGILAISGTIQAYKKTIHWEKAENPLYMIEYSCDDFDSCIRIEASANTLDNYLAECGIYQWRVSLDGKNWVCGEDIVSDFAADGKIKIFSDADGDMDVFFARSSGVWQNGFSAQHLGDKNVWAGTQEKVLLSGRNKLTDVFIGSTDANVLVLTDDTNGDALFFDDMYSAFGDQARLSRIDEIRAGAGDDIVDMTSQRFEYTGSGVKIYGGDGNDTIWANNGNNILFGDAGNDRLVGASGDDVIIGGIGNDSMHGGGGKDIFCFGGNWGIDTVEQLDGGSVTLWFEENNGVWDEDTLTYSCGENKVTVSGVVSVSLKFGNKAVLPDGAFADFSSEKIFEDKNKGMLA